MAHATRPVPCPCCAQGGAGGRRVRVVLPDVRGMVVEFSGDAPFLWLVTDAAWYLVGGFAAGLSAPSSSYKPAFALTQAKFEVRPRAVVACCKSPLAA